MARTDVLVVGAGPVGLSLALDLTRRGSEVMVVDASDGRVEHPRVGTVGPRSMELCRRWGLADDIKNAGWPGDHSLDIAWVTALGGHELHRLRYGTTTTREPSPWSPELEQVCPQHWLMPLLARHLAHAGTVVRRGRRVTRLVEDDGGVKAYVVDEAQPSREEIVDARYVAACDGAGSTLRKQAGVDAPARFAPQVFRNILFRAPALRSAVGTGEALVWFLTSPELLRYPLRAMDGDGLYRLTTAADDASVQLSGRELVSHALALEVEFETLSESVWHLTHTVADRYRHGRVFFVGDAAHTLSPSGGFGMNTGIADAADLGWRLAAELNGWAGPALLDQYEADRRPVAEAVLRQSEANLRRTLDRAVPSEITADGPEGQRVRAMMSERLRSARLEREFDALDAHFGHTYTSGAFRCDYPAPAEASWRSDVLVGMRAPHADLEDGRSTLDLFDRSYILMTPPEVSTAALQETFARRRVPLSVRVITTASERARYGDLQVLVRPDGFVSWRGRRSPDDGVEADLLVDVVRGACP